MIPSHPLLSFPSFPHLDTMIPSSTIHLAAMEFHFELVHPHASVSTHARARARAPELMRIETHASDSVRPVANSYQLWASWLLRVAIDIQRSTFSLERERNATQRIRASNLIQRSIDRSVLGRKFQGQGQDETHETHAMMMMRARQKGLGQSNSQTGPRANFFIFSLPTMST